MPEYYFMKTTEINLFGFYFAQCGMGRSRFEVVRRGECLCALGGILIPATAQRYSLPDNNAQQLCAVKTALRFFR